MTLHHTPQEVALLNFWYEFDNTFAYDRPDDVIGAIDIVSPYDRLFPKYIEFRNDGNYPEGFKSEFQGDVDSFRVLANHQLRLLHEHFQGDKTMEVLAFISFAQGILFDDLPRPPDSKRPKGEESIHMMNSDIASYAVWHAFIMALILIDDKADKPRWLEIDRYLVLAAAILEKLKSLGRQPVRADVPGTNVPLDESAVKELENLWLQDSIGFERIDSAITKFARI